MSSSNPSSPLDPDNPLFAAMENRCGDDPVFSEPWQAQAFGLAVTLNQAGAFDWPEFSQKLTDEIAAARSRGEPDTGERYYEFWLTALETLCREKNWVDASLLAERKARWTRAYLNTPHGKPILLEAGDTATDD